MLIRGHKHTIHCLLMADGRPSDMRGLSVTVEDHCKLLLMIAVSIVFWVECSTPSVHKYEMFWIFQYVQHTN